jgi:hypothetical protein
LKIEIENIKPLGGLPPLLEDYIPEPGVMGSRERCPPRAEGKSPVTMSTDARLLRIGQGWR